MEKKVLKMIKKIFDYGYEKVLQDIMTEEKNQYELMEEVKASMKAVDNS